MGASFRNIGKTNSIISYFYYYYFFLCHLLYAFTGEVKALCGCDFLTISPKLLEELENSNEPVYEHLTESSGKLSVGVINILFAISIAEL